MVIAEMIQNINNMGSFIKKGYELPYTLRRAIKKNNKAMMEEYAIYDEERKKMLEGMEDKSEEEKAKINEDFRELLATNVDIELIKEPVSVLSKLDMPYEDEMLIDFMLEEEDDEDA